MKYEYDADTRLARLRLRVDWGTVGRDLNFLRTDRIAMATAVPKESESRSA
jgi:hypothetical protein